MLENVLNKLLWG